MNKEQEIINRVANSPLQTIDLEDFYPTNPRFELDIKNWLYEEIILKEKDFRNFVDHHSWEQYKNAFVNIVCSVDAIIPSWAYLLIATKLNPFAKKYVVGSSELLETIIYQDIISNFDISIYQNKPVIIKGCANKPIPASAYSFLIQKLQPVAKSILFGEACSTVPLFKK